MLKKLGSIFFLFLFVTNITAYGQVKIGYMNSQEVLSQMPERSDVEQKLNSFVQQKRQELQQRTAAFQDSLATFQQNQGNLSEAQANQQEQQIAQMEASLQQFQQSLQQQIQQQRAQLLEPLYEKMDQAIAAVAESKDLDFVINEATSTGENVIYYSESQELNITEEVLQQINGTSAQN
jgi:outer membrane protein